MTLSPQEVLVFCLIGLIAGGLASMVVKETQLGCLGKMAIGIVGAVIGGMIFDWADVEIGGEWFGPIVTSTLGAVILLVVLRAVKRK